MYDSVLTHRLLKNARLKQRREQLIKATISDLSYDLMKDQPKKIFSDLSVSSSNTVPLPGDTIIKTKQTHQLEYESGTDTKDVYAAEITLARMVSLIDPLIKTKRKTNHNRPLIDPKEEINSISKLILPDVPFVNP